MFSIPCATEPLTLRADVQSGLAKNPAKYEWTSSILSKLPNTETVTIEKTQLTAGQHQFTLNITNIFDQSQTHTFEVEVTSQESLQVKIDAGAEATMKQSEYRVFSAKVAELCGQTVYPTWKWTSSTKVSSQTHRLVVHPDDLKAGDSYAFTVTATQGSLTGSASVLIQVQASDLVAIINKASGAVSNDVDLLLSAEASYDPDSLGTLGYKWSCLEAGYACTDLNGAPLLTDVSD